jgi:hypothetical protein
MGVLEGEYSTYKSQIDAYFGIRNLIQTNVLVFIVFKTFLNLLVRFSMDDVATKVVLIFRLEVVLSWVPNSAQFHHTTSP